MSETPKPNTAAPNARGLDTNVLVRYLVQDDPVQYEHARAFVEDELTPEAPGLVHPVALCEVVWALRQVYKVPAPEIAGALRLLLSVRTLQVLSEGLVREALDLYEAHGADFADALLAAAYNDAGTGLVTFDKGASRLPGARRLGAVEAPLQALRGSVPADGPQDADAVRDQVRVARAERLIPHAEASDNKTD